MRTSRVEIMGKSAFSLSLEEHEARAMVSKSVQQTDLSKPVMWGNMFTHPIYFAHYRHRQAQEEWNGGIHLSGGAKGKLRAWCFGFA